MGWGSTSSVGSGRSSHPIPSFPQIVAEKQQACETDLAKAEPALIAAQEALDTLNKVGDPAVGSSFLAGAGILAPE